MRERRDETAQALARDGNPAGGQVCIDSDKGLSQGHEHMIRYRADTRRPGFATQHPLALAHIGRTSRRRDTASYRTAIEAILSATRNTRAHADMTDTDIFGGRVARQRRPGGPENGSCLPVGAAAVRPVDQTIIHCWFSPAEQVAWSRAAPFAVDASATSRHLPLPTLVKVT